MGTVGREVIIVRLPGCAITASPGPGKAVPSRTDSPSGHSGRLWSWPDLPTSVARSPREQPQRRSGGACLWPRLFLVLFSFVPFSFFKRISLQNLPAAG